MARILYADDNEGTRKAFSNFVRSLDHELVAVNDGVRAWELLEKGERFDLIISDYEMPQMDGLALLQKARENPATAGIPFMLLSGRDDKALSERTARLGAQFFCKGEMSLYSIIPMQFSMKCRAS